MYNTSVHHAAASHRRPKQVQSLVRVRQKQIVLVVKRTRSVLIDHFFVKQRVLIGGKSLDDTRFHSRGHYFLYMITSGRVVCLKNN